MTIYFLFLFYPHITISFNFHLVLKTSKQTNSNIKKQNSFSLFIDTNTVVCLVLHCLEEFHLLKHELSLKGRKQTYTKSEAICGHFLFN